LSEQTADRVALSPHTLELMPGLGREQHKYLITEDESWICWDNRCCGMWAQDRNDLPPNTGPTVSSEKAAVSAYFSRCGFVSVAFLLMGQKYNSHFFTERLLPSIERKLAEYRPNLRTTAAHLHVDNAAPHPSKMPIEKIEGLGFIIVPQPAYPPDLAPCDFLMFSYLKHPLERKQFIWEDQVICAVREVSDTIPLQTSQNVMDDWQYQLRRRIELKGEHLL
jgi:hypothetical protein